jgi:hypothetical protein
MLYSRVTCLIFFALRVKADFINLGDFAKSHLDQGSFFWLQNTEGEPVVGGWLQIHQPQVLHPYFAARKKNPDLDWISLLWSGLPEFFFFFSFFPFFPFFFAFFSPRHK